MPPILFFFNTNGELGYFIREDFSSKIGVELVQVDTDSYYDYIGHVVGKSLMIPTDLDVQISNYKNLDRTNATRFDRSLYWYHMAKALWVESASSSFAALVSAIETLANNGESHQGLCSNCGEGFTHRFPGPSEGFREFLETYAPGTTLRKRRTIMYELRSKILHGSHLLSIDQIQPFGHYFLWMDEENLMSSLWFMTRIALRNWHLKNQLTTGI